MKLPKNPTEAQILAVTGLVIKSIYTRGTVAVQTLDLDSQGRLTGIFLGDGVRFRYTAGLPASARARSATKRFHTKHERRRNG